MCEGRWNWLATEARTVFAVTEPQLSVQTSVVRTLSVAVMMVRLATDLGTADGKWCYGLFSPAIAFSWPLTSPGSNICDTCNHK